MFPGALKLGKNISHILASSASMVQNPEKPSSAFSSDLQSLTRSSAREQVCPPPTQPPPTAGECQHEVRWGTVPRVGHTWGLLPAFLHRTNATAMPQPCREVERWWGAVYSCSRKVRSRAMSTIVAAFVSVPNFQTLPWGQGLAEGTSLPTYQPGFSWQARMGAELLQTHLTPAPAWGTRPILLLPGPNAAHLKSGSIFYCTNMSHCHLVWTSNHLLLRYWLVLHCRAQPDRHLHI